MDLDIEAGRPQGVLTHFILGWMERSRKHGAVSSAEQRLKRCILHRQGGATSLVTPRAAYSLDTGHSS